jgi:hypothetical protein
MAKESEKPKNPKKPPEAVSLPRKPVVKGFEVDRPRGKSQRPNPPKKER